MSRKSVGSERNGFDAFIANNIERFYRLAFRLTGSRPDAEDLVQDVVAKALVQWSAIERLDNPVTWVRKILYNQYIDNRRRYGRSPVQLLDDLGEHAVGEGFDAVSDPAPSPEQALDQARDTARVQAALDKLPDEQRLLILMHDVEGYELKEIQQVTEIPIGTIKSRLSRGRALLRALVAKGT